jgi:hypothetical protein
MLAHQKFCFVRPCRSGLRVGLRLVRGVTLYKDNTPEDGPAAADKHHRPTTASGPFLMTCKRGPAAVGPAAAGGTITADSLIPYSVQQAAASCPMLHSLLHEPPPSLRLQAAPSSREPPSSFFSHAPAAATADRRGACKHQAGQAMGVSSTGLSIKHMVANVPPVHTWHQSRVAVAVGPSLTPTRQGLLPKGAPYQDCKAW